MLAIFRGLLLGLVFVRLSWGLSQLIVSPQGPAFFTSFECGFERFSRSRPPISLKFYTILLVFLVFDVEIVIVSCSFLEPSLSLL